MELRAAMKAQYHAGLAMLAECVEKCPDDLWLEGKYPRLYWRIAFHAAFFTHLYMGQDEASFQRWPGCKPGDHWKLFEAPGELEPYELPQDAPAYRPGELSEYLRFVDGLVDATVDGLNLETEDTGFPWYSKMGKLSHQLMNLRHLQGHVGQLSELLMARDIDTDWISRSAGFDPS